MPKPTIAVLFGGRSSEHEISVITALQAIMAMDPLKYHVVPVYFHPKGKWYTGDALLDRATYLGFSRTAPGIQEVTLLPDPSIRGLTVVETRDVIAVDVYFLAFHGQYGEDGCVQGLLELADACYTGCGVVGSAVAMNKSICKMVAKAAGIPVLPGCVVTHGDAMRDFSGAREKVLLTPGLGGFPLFVKPCNLGSSIGVGRATDESTLNAALAKVFRYDTEALVEPCLQDLLEVNVSVLEGDPPEASVVEIPVASDQVLTYEDKYMRRGQKTGSQGMASLTRIIDPKDLDPSMKAQVTQYALKAFDVMRCRGVVRFDFMVDTATGKLYFNELNPLPGSLSFYLWEKSHPQRLYTRTIDYLIERAQERKASGEAVQRFVGFKALC